MTATGGGEESNGAGVASPPLSLAALRRSPALAWEAIRLVARAAPREALFAVALQVASAGLIAGQLFLIKDVVVQLVHLGHGSGWAIAGLMGGLLAVTAAADGAAAVLTIKQRLMGDLVTYHTLDGVISVASSVDYAHYETPGFHDQLERARNAALHRPVEVVNGVTILLTSAVTTIGIAVVLASLEPLLLPIILLSGVPLLIVSLQNSRRRYAFEYQWIREGREHLHLLDLLTGAHYAKELRLTDADIPLRRRYRELTVLRVGKLRAFLRRRMWASLGATALSAVGTGVALGSIVWLLATHRIGIGTAATAVLAMRLLSTYMRQANTSIGSIVEGGLFLDDYRQFLTIAQPESEPEAAPGDFAPVRFEGVALRDVTFAYPGTERAVLHDVSLELRPGEVVALVGANGSGKTTIVKLLCSLYRELEEGTILWSGVDARELSPAQIRQRITVLFQDFVHYELSVADNISLGRGELDADLGRIKQAALQSGVASLIRRLPRGYETRLGRRFEGGVELSGGEWQRLALARAFYRGGDLLVLDEPTAALDPRAEYELFEQVKELAAGKSVLLISHRFSSVRTADRIYVLDQGRIVEHGTHDALVAAQGLYAELYQLQASAYFGGDVPVALG